jgi:hypothetical protein
MDFGRKGKVALVLSGAADLGVPSKMPKPSVKDAVWRKLPPKVRPPSRSVVTAGPKSTPTL